MASFNDIIAAVSTPLGKGGVSVIRMCGEGALAIAEEVFSTASGKRICDYPPRFQIYGNIVYMGERLDDVLLTYFRAGSSYTGEETVEISCHGGVLITSNVLEALLAAGARPAEAGEFTRRAYVNGRLSLTEAEAIGDLLEAKSREQIRLAGVDARGRLNERIDEIRRQLTELLSSSYARIDYPDEDLGSFDDSDFIAHLERILESLESLIKTYRTGKSISEGVSTVICGKPNVGKSTVYNLLAGEELAIVTDISGTTRDVLERSVSLGRVMLNLADTAGIHGADMIDEVERIGIERSMRRMQAAELIFAVFDISRELDSDDERILKEINECDAAKIAILNKSDSEVSRLNADLFSEGFDAVITVSARNDGQSAIDAIRATVEGLFTDEKIVTGTDAIVSSARQNAKLCAARELVCSAIEAMRLGIPQDAASSDIERALAFIAEIDGKAVSEEVIGDIFSKFCVGK